MLLIFRWAAYLEPKAFGYTCLPALMNVSPKCSQLITLLKLSLCEQGCGYLIKQHSIITYHQCAITLESQPLTLLKECFSSGIPHRCRSCLSGNQWRPTTGQELHPVAPFPPNTYQSREPILYVPLPRLSEIPRCFSSLGFHHAGYFPLEVGTLYQWGWTPTWTSKHYGNYWNVMSLLFSDSTEIASHRHPFLTFSWALQIITSYRWF